MSNITSCYPEESDIQWVIHGMEKWLMSPFQNVNVKKIFENVPWSLISKQGNENKAYAAFMDYPLEGHYSKEWYQSIHYKWKGSPYYGVKTLFLHFLVCESSVKMFLEDILKITFREIPSLQWCCIVNNVSTSLDPGIEELFYEDESMESEAFQFWSVNRSRYIPKVGIRHKRSEDYLALKNMFSQMYGPFINDNLQKFTLDFLDYGEDKCPTYKYFTFDDDNTYIGIADNDIGEAIGFVYATIQRIDLDLMNNYFQLENVYGLRKRHPADKPEISFETEYSTSSSDDSTDEEYEVREWISNIIDEVVFNRDIEICLSDILDEVCDPFKTHHRRKSMGQVTVDKKTLINSEEFSLSNPYHTSLIIKNIKHFKSDTLVRLINSHEFDVNNDIHMKLVPRLGAAIKDINPNRIKEILNSDTFDPSRDDFATVTVQVMSFLPEHKLTQFKKSSVGYQLHEKIMFRKLKGKKGESPKPTRKTVVPRTSFKDTQIILNYAKTSTEKNPSEKAVVGKREILPDNLKRVHYRNMGFISGLTMRGKYRIQGSCSISKLKQPFGYEKKVEPEKTEKEEVENIRTFRKYPVPDIEEQRLVQEIPNYNGGTNCLYIEQLAVEKEYEYQSLYLIMSAFEYFPRVDYCALLLPYGTLQVPYLRSNFFSIPARPFTDYERELFVFHKAAFDRSYKVRMYKEKDLKRVKRLIQCSCLSEYLLEDLENSLKCTEKEIQTVVLLSEKQIFGVAIVKEIKEVETIRRKYDITERINMRYHKYRSNGLLLHCVLHPIFKSISKVFLKEIMRLCEKSILYYKIYPTHLVPYDPSLWQSLCNVFEHFVPLKFTTKASRIKSYIVNKHSKKEKDDDGNTTYADRFYCLCYTCTKLVLRDRPIISSRIIIIGNSGAALGVLESLIYRKDCKYTNITIITKFGIPGEFKLDDRCHSFLPIDTDYTKSVLDSLCLPAWVTIVRGEITAIRRNSLRIRELTGNKPQHFSVGFDYLIICNDLEFQTCRAKKSTTRKNYKNKEYPFSLLSGLWQETYTIAKNASNVFGVNNAYEAATFLNWAWRFFLKRAESRKSSKKKHKNPVETEKKEGRIVVYGNYLDAYTALGVILTEKFPLSKITFIKGPPDELKPTFNSKFVEEAIDHVLTESGLDIIWNATIKYNEDAEEVHHLDVTTEDGTGRLDCAVLLLCHEKTVNCNTFKILHKSSLSFTLPVSDSKGHAYLLTNPNFQTNIKNVFAAGTTTEMHTASRKHVRFEDCVYSNRETGMAIGDILSKENKDDVNAPETEFPVFTHPVVTHAKLPNGYFYTYITTPSSCFQNTKEVKEIKYRVETLVFGNLQTGAYIVPAPMLQEEMDILDEGADSEERMAYEDFMAEIRDFEQEEYGEMEETVVERILPDVPDYFALIFDENEAVQAIEVLTKKDIDVPILKNLMGIHLNQLYKMIHRVEKNTAELYFYLAEKWILPLDHVVFEDEAIEHGKRGYESFWRVGYPRYIERRLNRFLQSFAIHKHTKKKGHHK